MNKIISITIVVAAILLLASQASAVPPLDKLTAWDKDPAAFEHGIALDINGGTWYFAGYMVEPGVYDIPGHTWKMAGPDKVVGRHYNVGPYGATSWWAANESNGTLLFKVDGIIATEPAMLDQKYAAHLYKTGYVHIHEFVNETGAEYPDEDNSDYPDMVVYLKHTAVKEFDLFGDPLLHVTPGIYDFMPNWEAPLPCDGEFP